MEISEIRKFYKNTNILITGGTGFVGKVLIEKLLRDTDVNAIYVLIREKKNKSVQERLSELFQDPVFSILKDKCPEFGNKIHSITGECSLPGLGISETDLKDLTENINVIFHAAATVNFNENLKVAYDINFGATKAIIKIAKKMKKLKSFVFVSTAYANCIRDSVIEEKVYEYPFEEVIEMMDKLTKETAEKYTAKIIGNWPNTYTFTKALSEILIEKEKKDLPIGIFRPSIITSTYEEPIKGWIDNMYAINAISIAVATGFLRVYPTKPDRTVDIVPVDKTIAALIVASKETADFAKVNSETRVYNFITSNENPLSYEMFMLLNMKLGRPSINAVWYPCGIYVENEILRDILSFIIHIIPAFFVDCFAILTGNKPQLVSLYRKASRVMKRFQFFAEREFVFDNRNVDTMWKNLNSVDKELFPFSMKQLSWFLFCKKYVEGLEKYVLKEDDSQLERAYKKYHRFHAAHIFLKAVAVYLVYYLVNLVLCKLYHLILG